MRVAYADPPYLGMCKRYDHNHPDGRCWDEPETHRLLVERLSDDYDAWALHSTSVTLRDILPMCPNDARVMAWCKSFASFKPGVHPAYAWEPVIIRGARTRGRTGTTVTDYAVVPIVIKRGFFGAKPEAVVHWVLAALNVLPEDEVEDLFVGSGAVTRAIARFQSQLGWLDSRATVASSPPGVVLAGPPGGHTAREEP